MNRNLDEKYNHILNILNDGIKKIKLKTEENNIKLYCLYKGMSILCFDTNEELINYCHLRGLSQNGSFYIEYIGDFKGKNDVIKETVENKVLYLVRKNEEQYEVYCEERSKIANRPIWQLVYGNNDNMYIEFKKRGIEFHDVNIGIESKNKQYIKK